MNNTENTPENKAAFFANYPSVKIVFGLNRDELEGIIWTKQQIFLAKRTEGTRSTEYFIDYPECYIELRPLSQITDEDAIKFIKMVSPYTGRIEIKERIVGGIVFDCPYVGEQLLFRFKNLAIHKKNTEEEFNQYYTYSPILHLRGIDFLRSKGYLLPWRDLSVEEIISYGWAKYEA